MPTHLCPLRAAGDSSSDATPGEVVERIEQMRRNHKWSAGRIAFELSQTGHAVSRRTLTRTSPISV